MIIRMYPTDVLKGQKQIAYGNAVGLRNIGCRPERAKAQSLFFDGSPQDFDGSPQDFLNL